MFQEVNTTANICKTSEKHHQNSTQHFIKFYDPHPIQHDPSIFSWRLYCAVYNIQRGKGGDGDASSLKLNLTDPCRTAYSTVPVPLSRDAMPAGWVNCFCICTSTTLRAQNRAAKGSILKEDEILLQSGYIIYLCCTMQQRVVYLLLFFSSFFRY